MKRWWYRWRLRVWERRVRAAERSLRLHKAYDYGPFYIRSRMEERLKRARFKLHWYREVGLEIAKAKVVRS